MVSWARYPALDRPRPAGLSPRVIGGERRGRLRVHGVTITDGIHADAVLPVGTLARRSVLAAHAGADLILCPAPQPQDNSPAQGTTAMHALATDRARADHPGIGHGRRGAHLRAPGPARRSAWLAGMESPFEPYAVAHTSPLEDDLAVVAAATRAQTSAPGMMSGLVETRLLQTLVRLARPERVLEVGTFTALGALAMAEALPAGGSVTTLEADPANAALAHAHIAAHPAGGRVELLQGDALQQLRTLPGPFGLAYVDAWKPDYPAYFELVLPLLAPDGLMVFDNVLRGGAALEPGDPVGAFNDLIAADARVDNALLTIGDGVLLVWPRAAHRGG